MGTQSLPAADWETNEDGKWGRKVKDDEASTGNVENGFGRATVTEGKLEVVKAKWMWFCTCTTHVWPRKSVISDQQHYDASEVVLVSFCCQMRDMEAEFCWSILLAISQPVLQRAQRSAASKSNSSITAEPKIDPACADARPLNTLLQHCYWTNVDSWSKQHAYTQRLDNVSLQTSTTDDEFQNTRDK